MITISFVICSSSIQESKVEDTIINCQNKIYNDFGLDIKKSINKYEQTLIKEGILEDCSGESYIALLNKIVIDESYQIDSIYAFFDVDPWFKVHDSIKNKIRDCENIQINNSENTFKWIKIDKEIDSLIYAKIEPTSMSKLLLKNLTEDDFKIAFYKHKTFLAIEMINSKYGSRNIMMPPE